MTMIRRGITKLKDIIKGFNKNHEFIPEIFNRDYLSTLGVVTPIFIFSKEALTNRFNMYKTLMPINTEIAYSMKANAEECVLKTLNDLGSSFEVASKYELEMLKVLNVDPNKIIYGSSVKSLNHIHEFIKYGVNRYAADSEPELVKIASVAPGSKVYVRTLVNDKANSVFHMSEKFGVSLQESVRLMILAKDLGLIPYGLSFNVGSQARNENAWAEGIKDVSKVMKILLKNGIKIEIINMGGGFPQQYKNEDKVPKLKQITDCIKKSIRYLPYPVHFIIEPGRGLVASSFILVVSITEKIKRPNGHWLHLDAGTYNALLEAMSYQGRMRYKIIPIKDYPIKRKEAFILTGPACDDLDVIDQESILPVEISVGDQLVIYDVGAYTFTLMTRFNGFPKPEIIIK